MSEFLMFALGWLVGVFTPQVLQPLSRAIGIAWHLATRRHLNEHDATSYAIHKALKIHNVRKFFRIPSPPI